MTVRIYIARDGSRDRERRRLMDAAAAFCAALGRDVPPPELAFGAQGKPCFAEAPELCFSVTHSGEFWLCAFSDKPVGLDLERRRELRAAALAARFFHPEEARHLAARPEDFFDVWTAKESYVKRSGLGIAGQFKGFSVVENGALREELNGVRLRHLPLNGAYSLCLCCEEKAQVRMAWLE